MSKYYPTARGRKYVFRDLNLEIPDWANIGVLGLNGAGKSTLIRLLAGSEHPNAGKITVEGSVSWPLGLSGGVQGSLTGRENAEFVCRIYGSNRHEVREKIDFIKEFSELGEFFELPVKTYSSGMRSRLTFGMSMAFDFDIYLIDELTAVGDARFREKSEDALRQKRDKSRYIMVSHNINHLIRDSQALIVLHDGDVSLFHSVAEGLEFYKSHIKVTNLT